MPRTKQVKIYAKENRPYKTDFELVKNAQAGDKAAYEEMWDKYYLLRQKEKFSFIKWCKAHNIAQSMFQDYADSWDSDAYEKFYNQMTGVRLNELLAKGHTPDKWGITIRLIGYFHVVNRSYTNALLKKLNKETNECSVRNKDKDKDNSNAMTNIDLAQFKNSAYDDNEMKSLAKEVFNEAWQNVLNEMDDKQRALIEMKSNKSTTRKICQKFGLSSKAVNSYIDYSKTRLQSWIDKVSKSRGIPMTYEDIVSALS